MGSNVFVAASGAEARLRQLELVAHNLANAESIGYKADRAVFHAAVEAALAAAEGEQTGGAGGGVYVRVGDTGHDHSAGPVKRTGAALNAAIDGPGFFVIDTPRGERYTRAGNFSVDAQGRLVMPSGDPVQGDGGPIQISGPARILPTGDVVEERILPGETEPRVVGTLRVVRFEEPNQLVKDGYGLFDAPEALEPQAAAPSLIEGSLEGSNVQPVVELARLMILQRAFEASMQAMQRDDSATERLIQEISQ